MPNELVFLDANVLLELILRKRRLTAVVQQFIHENQTVISPLSAHLAFYFGQKDGLQKEYIFEILKNFQYTEFGANEVMWAMENCQDNDFEDALQVACAVLNGAKLFVTIDKKLAKKYQQFINIQLLK